MKRAKLNCITAAIGVLLIVTGLFLIKGLAHPQGFLLALPYVLVGIGCGVFGQGMGELISRQAVKNNPAALKQLEIDQKDERNQAISNYAKAKAFDRMTFVFAALMVAFALMGVELVAILLLVIAYLFVQGCGIYYRCKYDREM